MASRIGARNLRRYLTTIGKPLGKAEHAAEKACFKVKPGTEAGAIVESKDSASINKAEQEENACFKGTEDGAIVESKDSACINKAEQEENACFKGTEDGAIVESKDSACINKAEQEENACFKGTEDGAIVESKDSASINKAEQAVGSGVSAGDGVELKDSASNTKAEPAGPEYPDDGPENLVVMAGLLAFNALLWFYIMSDYRH